MFTGERLIPQFNKGTAFYFEHLARYFFCCQFTKNKIVLDAGSGSGYGTYILATQGKAKQVTGIDLSETTINYSIKEYSAKNNKFIIDDIEKLNTITDKSVDVLVNFEVIEHLDNPEKFLSQARRVINSKGMVIISTPNKLTYPPGNKYHIKEYSPNEFNKLLNKYFLYVQIIPQNFRLSQEITNDSNSKIKIDSKIDKKLYKSGKDSIDGKNNIKDSEYIIAVCSNVKIQDIVSFSLPINRVDHYDLTKGLTSLSKQYSDMHLHNQSLEAKIKRLTLELDKYLNGNSPYKNYVHEIGELKSEISLLKSELRLFYIEYGNFIAKYSELYPNVYLHEMPELSTFANQNYSETNKVHEPTFYKDFYYKVSSSKTYRLWQWFSKLRKIAKNKITKYGKSNTY